MEKRRVDEGAIQSQASPVYRVFACVQGLYFFLLCKQKTKKCADSRHCNGKTDAPSATSSSHLRFI